MTAEAVKAALSRAVKRAWPGHGKASELPFPKYWRAQTEWLTFHAPHVADRLMIEFIDDAVGMAAAALSAGTEPTPWTVPDEIKAIWNHKDVTRDAWAHAAERVQDVRDRSMRLKARQEKLFWKL